MLSTYRCHIVDNLGDLVIADKFDPSSDQFSGSDDGERVSMATEFGHIFDDLLTGGVFVQNTRVDYQGVCQFSPDIPKVTFPLGVLPINMVVM